MDDLVTALQLYEVEMQVYANHLMIIIKRNSEVEKSQLLPTILITVDHCGEREGMSINPPKMVSVPFFKKGRLGTLRYPSINEK